MFRVFTTNEFDKDIAKLNHREQLMIKKILNQLKEQGGDVGKPLAGLRFFREKKFDEIFYWMLYDGKIGWLYTREIKERIK